MMGDSGLLNDMKQSLSLHIVCDAPYSTTHVRDAGADDVNAA